MADIDSWGGKDDLLSLWVDSYSWDCFLLAICWQLVANLAGKSWKQINYEWIPNSTVLAVNQAQKINQVYFKVQSLLVDLPVVPMTRRAGTSSIVGWTATRTRNWGRWAGTPSRWRHRTPGPWRSSLTFIGFERVMLTRVMLTWVKLSSYESYPTPTSSSHGYFNSSQTWIGLTLF